jgi:meso-butanediol dehydrogenase / (S,S)-butanediol dehydrogenase / diacetyl reductase
MGDIATQEITMNAYRRASHGPVAGRLSGKVAVISGVGGGQGRAAALLFARSGATVVGSDRKPDGLEETQELAAREGLSLQLSVVPDLADPEAAQHWIDRAAATNGRLDVLYNNAASVHFAPIAEMTPKLWAETLKGELDIVFLPTRAAWRHLARAGGSIINSASLSGMRALEHVGAVAHAASKGGVIAMTRQLALEGAPVGIRVNSISPGPIVTPATQDALATDPTFKRHFEGWPLLGRGGEAEDVAYAALFLASDESAFITGINLPVDGGMSSKTGITEHV